MDFFEVLKARRSVRQFTHQPVPEEALQRILSAAQSAPSAGNLQAYEIYAVQTQRQKDALAQAALGQEFIAQAPLVLVFCAHPQRSEGRYGARGVNLYTLQDATIACAFAMLAAASLGLGTVWVGAFDEDSVSQIISAPTGVKPVALLPLGYPAEQPPARSRRSLKDLVH